MYEPLLYGGSDLRRPEWCAIILRGPVVGAEMTRYPLAGNPVLPPGE